MAKSIYMGTTKVAATKTAGEIMEILRSSGATQASQEWGANGQIVALRFVLPVGSGSALFCLPVRTELLTKKLRGDKQQAERTAWRQLLRWVEAQLAMIDVGMVQAAEVYAPYMETRDGRTLYQLLSQDPIARHKLLGSGSEL